MGKAVAVINSEIESAMRVTRISEDHAEEVFDKVQFLSRKIIHLTNEKHESERERDTQR